MERKHWLFQLPCGCNEAICDQRVYPTRAKAWNSVYHSSKEKDQALARGVTVVGITHQQWVDEHAARHGDRCTHRGKT